MWMGRMLMIVLDVGDDMTHMCLYDANGLMFCYLSFCHLFHASCCCIVVLHHHATASAFVLHVVRSLIVASSVHVLMLLCMFIPLCSAHASNLHGSQSKDPDSRHPSGASFRHMDRRLHPLVTRHIPSDVDLACGVCRAWSQYHT